MFTTVLQYCACQNGIRYGCTSVNPQFEYSPLFLTENRHHIVPVDWESHPCPGKGQSISSHVVDYVVDGAGPDLVGRDWLSQLPHSLEVNHVECKSYVFTCTRQRIGTIYICYTQEYYSIYTLVMH